MAPAPGPINTPSFLLYNRAKGSEAEVFASLKPPFPTLCLPEEFSQPTFSFGPAASDVRIVLRGPLTLRAVQVDWQF